MPKLKCGVVFFHFLCSALDTWFVGLNAGFNTLQRPLLYGAYHGFYSLQKYNRKRKATPTAVKNAENDNENSSPATIVGPICETGDVFARKVKRFSMRRFGFLNSLLMMPSFKKKKN